MRFAFIAEHAGRWPVTWLCVRLAVSASGYYRWAKTAANPSDHAKRDEKLKLLIRVIFKTNKGIYGATRITEELRQGPGKQQVSQKRVGWLITKMGLAGCAKKPSKRKTTDGNHALQVANNLLQPDFKPEAANQVWAADITYVRTWQGWFYLAVILDLFSRRVVGLAMANHMRTELVLDALRMAHNERRPSSGLIHHSDRGSTQYASYDYQKTPKNYGMVCSMSRKGNCWDNAPAESFFGSYKQELINRRSWATGSRVIIATADYINGFYNSRRRHSALGFLSPLEYELKRVDFDTVA